MAEPAKGGMKARSYQLELLNYVMDRNAIIYLPTGAGKTFVAILALKRFSHQMDKTIENGGKRAIFMCNTVELARQQSVEVRRHTNLKVGFYVGEREVDSWTPERWKTEIDENQILVGTAQIFVDIVSKGIIKLSGISVVVIDECHHATKRHPMHEFMRLFQYCDNAHLPRVIGLTGVLIKSNFKLNSVEEELNILEATFRGNILTVSGTEEYANVLVFSTKPKEEVVVYSSQQYKLPIQAQISNLINEMCAIIDVWDLGIVPPRRSKGLTLLRQPSKKSYLKSLLRDFEYQMEDFGVYAAAVAIMSPLIDIEIKRRRAETLTLRNLYRSVICRCEYIRHILVSKLKDYYDDASDDVDFETVQVIENYSTPKLCSLLTYFKNTFSNKQPNDISCLVFVQRRYTAKCLYHILQKYLEHSPDLQKVLNPQFMIGRNSINPGIEGILDRKWNRQAIDEFRRKECNLIICSNVLEEGIDIQACNYVLAFDPLKTFSSYIQTKGRARSNESVYAIFTSKLDQMKVVGQIVNYKEVHQAIKKYLQGRLLDRTDPNEEDIAEEFLDSLKPFILPNGATLLPSSGLQLLSRYCNILPSDAFGIVLPWFTIVSVVGGKCVVSVQMPMQSPVKEVIYSDPMANSKLAKISAAMKAIIKLYEIGAINDKLLPVTKRECVSNVAEVFFQHWKKHHMDVTAGLHARTLGKQFRRNYATKCPKEFYAATPVIGEVCYAYKITITPVFEENEYSAHIFNGLKSSSTYAILVRSRLPRLAEMPLFMNQGKLNVKISDEPIECCIEQAQQLQSLIDFHQMIFRDLLQLWKCFFVVDKRNKENSYLIAPMREDQIDWNLVKKFPSLQPNREYSVAERQQAVYNSKDWMGKVVNKWYSGSDDERYVVTKVYTNLTPHSKFDASSQSYADFFESKYKSAINRVVHQDQFLIEVSQLTSRRNFFVNAVGKAAVSRKNRNTIILIPELCHNFMFPGDMWMKALLLPSILYRLRVMLHADALRVRINDFLGVANHSSYTPKPLTMDTSLRRAVDNDGNAIEKIEDPKVMLLPFPAKAPNPTRNTRGTENLAWKDYMEPGDYGRKANYIYPVEIDYYFNFINGLVDTDLDNYSIDETEQWMQSQFSIGQSRKKTMNTPLPDNRIKLAITDVPMDDRRHINILSHSFEEVNVPTAEQAEFVAALTTAGANDVFDMERFELLGDSFLKFSASLYLANKFPNWHEGFLTEVKSKIVSNRNLLYCMLELDIPERICASIFKPNSDWLPPRVSLPSNALDLLLENRPDLSNVTPRDLYELDLSEEEITTGKCSEEKLQRLIQSCKACNEFDAEGKSNCDVNCFLYRETMSDKIVADTLEALLGVCVKNYGIHRAFRMLDFFGIFKDEKAAPLTHLLDLKLGAPSLRTNISSREVDGFLINHEKLEENLGYKFRDRAYLLQALTHPSYPTNRITGCYQELEFIGDAILDFLISCYIFEKFEHMTPGMLTDLRSALVNNITLGCVCVRFRFHLFLLAENSALSETINSFVEFQEFQGHRVTDQVRILMEEPTSRTEDNEVPLYNMSVNIDVPKALGDIVEAIIAAVYLDSRDLRTTWNVIYHLLQQEIVDFSKHVPIDPVRQLYENQNADAKFSESIVDKDVVMVQCVFKCLENTLEVSGFGSNSKQAKKAAAKHALRILGKNS